MTRRKPDATVTAFADHEVIVPKKTLTHLAKRVDKAGEIDAEAVARAEAALNALSPAFDGWMATECDRLEAARQAFLLGGPSKGSAQVLFRAAHDIKGEAATFGFPLAAEIAASLCRLVFHTPKPAALPMELVERHVVAIRAVVRQNVRSPGDATACEILARLRELTEAFLAHSGDAEWQAEHGAPPLAPSAAG